MGKQIQIVGQNVRPVVLKELDLNANGIFTFLKPSEDDVVEVNNSEFIRAIKDIDTFNKWVVEYKRDENTIIPLRTAASQTLREQTIGRGLRLPYGSRTGVQDVDALVITAHDKFEDIIREASNPNSLFDTEVTTFNFGLL